MNERRVHPRYPAHWHVAIICDCRRQDETNTLNGMTGDVSVAGANILTRHNFCAGKDVLVLLEIPPVHAGGEALRLQIQGRTTYTVLDGSLNLFRSGIQFCQMADEDHQQLALHLASRFGAFPLGNPGLPGQ